ncbi:uncharacterized protein LOC123558148 [Mercenaria mercenaria]|uniref:uncharacterized protein LOC123558148 n=1 Tax=Mercenaria mercenaria TaxID=6596 RepID=UPI00234EB052|nr:uncharacterized protein LOC123558148 [Mercenaria mercenaria]
MSKSLSASSSEPKQRMTSKVPSVSEHVERKKRKLDSAASSQKPGPSGCQIIPVSDSESDLSAEEEMSADDLCCVCKQFQPKEMKNCISCICQKRQRLDQQFADNATNTDSMQSSIFTIPLRTRHAMMPRDASGSTPPRAQANPEYAAELTGLASEEDYSTHYYYYVHVGGSIGRPETWTMVPHLNDHYLTPVFVFTEQPRLSSTDGNLTEQPEEQHYAHIRPPSCEQQIDQPAPLPPPCQKQPCNVSLQPYEHNQDDNDIPLYRRQTAVSSNILGCSPKTTAIYESLMVLGGKMSSFDNGCERWEYKSEGPMSLAGTGDVQKKNTME